MVKYLFLLEEVGASVCSPALQWPGSFHRDLPGSCTAKAKDFVEVKLHKRHFPLGTFLLVSSVKESPFCVIPPGMSFGHQLNKFIKSQEHFLCALRQAARKEELPPWGFESVSSNSSTSLLLYVRVRGVLIPHTN